MTDKSSEINKNYIAKEGMWSVSPNLSSVFTSDGYLYANEVKAMNMNDEEALQDRKRFVRNLGILVSQTRNGIIEMSLNDDEIVTIKFKNGFERYVNVRLDSYSAIIRDVCKNID